MSDALHRLETWPATHPDLVRGLPVCAEHMRPQVDPNGAWVINTLRWHDLTAVTCGYARPHVDTDLPQWSILWTLHSAPHRVWSADYVPKNITLYGRKSRNGLISADLMCGTLAILHTARLHGLDKPVGNAGFVAVLIDLEVRPARKGAEALMAERVSRALAWEDGQ